MAVGLSPSADQRPARCSAAAVRVIWNGAEVSGTSLAAGVQLSGGRRVASAATIARERHYIDLSL